MKVKVKGPIISNDWKWIYNWFGMDATCPKDIEDALTEANGEDVDIEINSGGGDVYAGSEIYTLLKSYTGNITGKIMGIAASAASVIGMGCSKLLITPTGQVMIHNVQSAASGDHNDLEHEATVLKGWDKSIANSYMLKTGKSQKDILKLMSEETWLTAQEALEKGFVDEIMFDNGLQLVASANSCEMIPQKVISKLASELKGKMFSNDFNGHKLPIENKPEAKNDKGDEKGMTLEELKNNHPELYNQVVNTAKEEGKKEGAQAERTRIKDIMDISNTIDSDLVNKAIFEEPMTAKDLAFEALKNDAGKGTQYLKDSKEDIENSGSKEVKGSNNDGEQKENKPKTVQDKFKNLAATFDASRRGVKK